MSASPKPIARLANIITFRALAYPLPEAYALMLKRLALPATEARINEDKDAEEAAVASLDEFVDTLRSIIGEPVTRPEFTKG